MQSAARIRRLGLSSSVPLGKTGLLAMQSAARIRRLGLSSSVPLGGTASCRCNQRRTSDVFGSCKPSPSRHGGEMLFRRGENVVHIIVNGQSSGLHGPRLLPLHDFLARNIENGGQDLLPLLIGGLRQQEQHSRAVL